MKKLSLLAVIVFSLGLIASCGVSRGYIVAPITQVDLKFKNFTVVQVAKGEASASYVFGFMGPRHQDLVGQAYRNMVDNAKLVGSSRALANVTVDSQNRFFVFWSKKTVYVTAVVIEFKN